MEGVLSAFAIDWRLLIAQMVNYGLVLVILWAFVYKPVLRILDERQQKIAKGIEDAEAAQVARAASEEAALLRAKEADKEGQEIVARARKHAHELENSMMVEASVRAERIQKEAEMLALAEKEKMLKETEAEIARLAILGAKKLLTEKAI